MKQNYNSRDRKLSLGSYCVHVRIQEQSCLRQYAKAAAGKWKKAFMPGFS